MHVLNSKICKDMSNITTYVDCPTTQDELNRITRGNGVFNLTPLTQLMFGAVSMNEVQQQIHPGVGKTRDVQVTYSTRRLENEVSDTVSFCGTGESQGNLSHTYTLDTTDGVKASFQMKETDLRAMCKDNREVWQMEHQRLINVIIRRMETRIAQKIATIATTASFSTLDRDQDNSTIAGSPLRKVVSTKMSAANGPVVIEPECLDAIQETARLNRYNRSPIILGDGEIRKYFRALDSGAIYDYGIDLKQYAAGRQETLIVSEKLQTELGTSFSSTVGGRDIFMTLDPGALFPIFFNRYSTLEGYEPLNHLSEGNRIKTVMLVPVGENVALPMDYVVREDANDCDNYIVEMGLAFDIQGLPTDMFHVGDDLDGNIFVHPFQVVNPA